MSRKVRSEHEKNNPGGTNKQCCGVIPFLDLGHFNPGEFFEWYLSLIPDDRMVDKVLVKDGYLFPKPKSASKTFNIFSPETKLFEPNRKVGVHTLENMLPTLCEIVKEERCTNHRLRATAGKSLQIRYSIFYILFAVMYMRRAKLPWETIIKITGHATAVSLVKHYDLRLEAPGLAQISHIIGTGHSSAQGIDVALPQLVSRKRSIVGDSDEDDDFKPNPRPQKFIKQIAEFKAGAKEREIQDRELESEMTDRELLEVVESEPILKMEKQSSAAQQAVEMKNHKSESIEKDECKVDKEESLMVESLKEKSDGNGPSCSKVFNAGSVDSRIRNASFFAREFVRGVMEGGNEMMKSAMDSMMEYSAKFECQNGDSIQKVEVNINLNDI